MTTQSCIADIQSQFDWTKKNDKTTYAVFKPQSLTDGVDWSVVKEHFPEAEIHGYSMTDKVVIWASKEDMENEAKNPLVKQFISK